MIMKSKAVLTNPDKIYWPGEGITKGDLFNYYEKIAPVILPYLKNRPLSLKRNPDGIRNSGFYQKNAENIAPDWMKTIPVYVPSTGKTIQYIICNDKSSLLFVVNLGCIEINPWNSALPDLDKPDYLVMDIDPSEKNSFRDVIEVTLALKEVMDEWELNGYCKTSGASGMHIYLPCRKKYTYEQVRNFAKVIALQVNQKLPGLTTIERSLSKRKKNQVYLDYLQNSKGQTLASAYSVRPRVGATVSTPLEWKEVKPGLDPSSFSIKTIYKRITRKGDLFAGVKGKAIDIPKAMRLSGG
jgi:bifunctional non-homologous end joining protein LigD